MQCSAPCSVVHRVVRQSVEPGPNRRHLLVGSILTFLMGPITLKTMKDTIYLYNIKKNFQHSLIIKERKLAKASKNSHIIEQNLINIIWRLETWFFCTCISLVNLSVLKNLPSIHCVTAVYFADWCTFELRTELLVTKWSNELKE